MDIQLFLAHADEHRPVLEDGLPQSSAYDAPRPDFRPPNPTDLASRYAPPDSLPDQRWAVIAPKGAAGDRLLRLVEPLRRRREEEQGGPAIVYRVDPGMPFDAANAWIQSDYWDEVERCEDDLPRYVLVLGDADVVSWELQQMLGSEAFVGRLAFPDDRGYEAYVEKVLRWEAQEPAAGARALFFQVQDGTRATVAGYRHLVMPSLQIARDRAEKGRFPAEIQGIGLGEGPCSDGEIADQAQEMLREAERARAGLLFSLSHGAGAPRAGWPSPGEQRAHQGAMMLGRSGDRITARDLASRAFLPGGFWFFFACFSAGTPARSAYFPWLDRLHRLGRAGPAERALASLPASGESPFVAALPQAALANPEGPLGVVGHVDLAWTWSFLDSSEVSASPRSQRRAERFQGLFRALVNGHRLGVGHNEISRYFCSLSTQLATMYGEDAERAAAPGGGADGAAREARRAGVWMQRQDLCAYVLLGDPAARLPIARWPAGVQAPRSASRAASAAPERARSVPSVLGFSPDPPPVAAPARDPQRLEEAVLAAIRGADEPSLAAEHAISEGEIRRGVGAFLEAGRAALRKLP